MKLGESILTGKYFHASGNHFQILFQKKQFFCIVETFFSLNVSFLIVEMDFLASTNDNLISIYWKEFFNESFIPAIAEGFSLYWKPSSLLESFSY